MTAVGNHDIDRERQLRGSALRQDRVHESADSARVQPGDVVPFHVQRDGKPMQLNVTLEHRDAKDYVSAPYSPDQPPRYYVLGGLIFQELSRQYLKEWGPNWQREAPQRLVYIDHFQSELFPERNRRVVILSQVLPANSTIGYDDTRLSNGEKSERKRNQIIGRSGRSCEATSRRLHQNRDRRRSQADRARRVASRR